MDRYVKELHSNVCYRCIGTDFSEGILACGFMKKTSAAQSQVNFQNEFYSGFFLLRGSGRYVTTDGAVIPLRAGNFVQRIPGEVHSTYVDPDGQWLEFFISFGKSRYENLKKLGLLPKERVSAALITGYLDECNLLLETLRRTDEDLLPVCLPALESQLLKMLCLGTRSVSQAPLLRKDMIQRAASVLSSNPGEDIDIKKLAGEFHMSYESFRKEFKKELLISPAKYRIQQKIRHACYMLRSGISIKETAQLTGYSDVYSFTKQFTKIMGISPGEYRRSELQNGS